MQKFLASSICLCYVQEYWTSNRFKEDYWNEDDHHLPERRWTDNLARQNPIPWTSSPRSSGNRGSSTNQRPAPLVIN